MAGVLGVGWPVEHVTSADNDMTFRLAMPSPPAAKLPTQWLFMVKFEDWECLRVTCEAPEEGRLLSDGIGVTRRAKQRDAIPFLSGLAWECFGDLPLPPLRELAALRGCDISGASTLAQVLAALISNILEIDQDTEAMIAILEMRNIAANVQVTMDIVDEVLQQTEGVDLSRFEEEDFIKTKESAARQEDARSAYRREVTARRAKVVDKIIQDKKTKAALRKRLENPLGKVRFPVQTPEGETITLEEVRALLPPGYKVNMHRHQARWEVSLLPADVGPLGSAFYISKSWGKYGFKESSLVAARTAWEHYMSHNPKVTHQCSICACLLIEFFTIFMELDHRERLG